MKNAKKNRIRAWAGRLALLALGIALPLAGAELAMRAARPNSGMGAGRELPWFRSGAARTDVFTIDPELGFRPRLDNEYFTATGCRRNGYPEAKRPGVERLLFIGDSVTMRGRIVEAIRRAWGEERYEYWNAGVESYGTVQEVHFYKRYNAAIHPDRVILTFHVNDFETTPVVFQNAEGNLVVYTPKSNRRRPNPFLFKRSYLYRLWLGATVRRESDSRERLVAETAGALRDLRDTLARDGAQLTVLFHPILRPLEAWRPDERESREDALRLFKELGIRYYDLYEVVPRALADGIEVLESEQDALNAWHPSDAMAERFAQFLRERGFLGEP